MNSGEHPHKERKKSEIGLLSYMSQRQRGARNKKAQRLLSRAGPEFSAQRPHGAKNCAGKGAVWIVCAEGDQINTVKDPQILCLNYAPLKYPLANFHSCHKQSYRKGHR